MSTPAGFIALWPRNARESVAVQIGDYQGTTTIDIRSWYADRAGTLQPSKAGITLGIRHLPLLLAALQKAMEQAHVRGLLSTGHDTHNAAP